MTPKRLMIDVSLIKNSNCLREVNYSHNHGFTSKHGTYKMEYGSAGHEYMKIWYSNVLTAENPYEYHQQGLSAAMAKYVDCEVPEDDFRQLDHLLMVLQMYNAYVSNLGDGDFKPAVNENGEALVELPFALPYGKTPKKGIEVIICGTTDMIIEYNGRLGFVDHKITALWGEDQFLRSFILSPQLFFYAKVIKKLMNLNYYPTAFINGIFLKKGTQKEPYRVCSIKRSEPIEISPMLAKEFNTFFDEKIAAIMKAVDDEYYPPNFNCCTKIYGQCSFTKACQLEFDEDRVDVLKSTMKQREYNPLNWSK